MAAYLTDIGFSEYVCESRVTEGLGYSNIPSHQPYSTMTSLRNQVVVSNAGGVTLMENIPANTVMPSNMPTFCGKGGTVSNGEGI